MLYTCGVTEYKKIMQKITLRNNSKEINHLAWGMIKKGDVPTWAEAVRAAINALGIKQKLDSGRTEFSFTKKSTGEIRKAHGTRNLKLIPVTYHPKSGSAKPKSETTNAIPFFDLDKMGWRSFCANTIVEAA